MTTRTLLVAVHHIKKAARNKDYCDALSFALFIKARHRNSMLLDYSWRKIMSLCHCNLDKAKKIRDNALDFGLIRITDDGRHIIAERLHNPLKREKCTELYIHSSGISVLENIVTDDRNTIKTLSDLLLCIAIFYNIYGYNRKLNTWQTRANELRRQAQMRDLANGGRIGGKRYDVDERGITITMPNERGYSHQSMLLHIFENSIGLSKLKALLNHMGKLGIIKIKKNVTHFMDMPYGENYGYETYCPIVDDETGRRELRYCYKKKVDSKAERDGEYDRMYRRMGNSYKCLANLIICKRIRRRTRKSFVPVASSVEPNFSLPF